MDYWFTRYKVCVNSAWLAFRGPEYFSLYVCMDLLKAFVLLQGWRSLAYRAAGFVRVFCCFLDEKLVGEVSYISQLSSVRASL